MASDQRTANGPTGADHFWIAQRLTLSAWVIGAVLQVCLFARPTPVGLAFIREWPGYLLLALLYEGLENYLIALPFLVFWLVLFNRTLFAGSLRWVYRAHVTALAVGLLLTQLDHEIMRFAGTRLTPSYLQVSTILDTSWRFVFDSILVDKGGPMLPVLLSIGGPLAFVAWARRTLRTARPLTTRRSVTLALLMVALPILVPACVRQSVDRTVPSRRVEPLLWSGARDL